VKVCMPVSFSRQNGPDWNSVDRLPKCGVRDKIKEKHLSRSSMDVVKGV
jgi:hypothetical protein